jgi:hypothetical protein
MSPLDQMTGSEATVSTHEQDGVREKPYWRAWKNKDAQQNSEDLKKYRQGSDGANHEKSCGSGRLMA